MRAAVDLLRRFFAWWLRELRACLPSSLRRRLRRRGKLLLLAIEDDQVKLRLRKGDRWRDLGAVALKMGMPGSAREPVERIVRAAGRSEVAIALPSHKVLRRLVQLPAAALENLREVLSFEMDRHTPLKAEQVAFDYRLIASDSASKRISVDLAVAQRSVVEQAARLAGSLGCVPSLVCVSAADLEAPQPMNLLAAQAEHPRPAISRLAVLLLILALGLAVAAVYLPLHFKRELLASYEARLAESRAAAMQADALSKRLETVQAQASFLVSRRRSEPMVTALLNELSWRVPQNTWLLEFDLRGREVGLAGLSPHASTLIAEIEASKMLSEVQFAAPVVMDADLGLEKFQLSLVVAAEPGE